MMSNSVPQELMDILDSAAGKKHSQEGVVAQALANILTRHREMVVDELTQRDRKERASRLMNEER